MTRISGLDRSILLTMPPGVKHENAQLRFGQFRYLLRETRKSQPGISSSMVANQDRPRFIRFRHGWRIVHAEILPHGTHRDGQRLRKVIRGGDRCVLVQIRGLH